MKGCDVLVGDVIPNSDKDPEKQLTAEKAGSWLLAGDSQGIIAGALVLKNTF